MAPITDEYMRDMLARTRDYIIVLLKTTSRPSQPDDRSSIWEHARRNFSLRADGVLRIVCPIGDESDTAGLCIFTASADEVRVIMDADPAVQAGIFSYEVHPCRSFPGDGLPA